MNGLAGEPLPWGEILAISLAAFVAVKLLVRGGWINLALLPVLAPLAAIKLLVFSLMGRTRPYWERLRQSPQVSNVLVFRGRPAGPKDETGQPADPWELSALRAELVGLAEKWNAHHRWFEAPMHLALHEGQVVGICRLFTIPKALGIGADRRVYRDVERVLGFLRESSERFPIEWTLPNTIGVQGRVAGGEADADLQESLAVLRGTVYWRHRRATPPTPPRS